MCLDYFHQMYLSNTFLSNLFTLIDFLTNSPEFRKLSWKFWDLFVNDLILVVDLNDHYFEGNRFQSHRETAENSEHGQFSGDPKHLVGIVTMFSSVNIQHQLYFKNKYSFYSTALAIRKKVWQQVFALDICQFEGISTAKI